MSRIPPSEPEAEGKPSSVDIHVGHRIRLRRTLLGMTEEKLGETLGLTVQQVQHHESGATRINASRLFDLARALEVPIGFFFDDMPSDLGPDFPGTPFADLPPASPGDQILRRETLDLVRAYHRIADPVIRRRIHDLANALAAADAD